MGLYGSAPEPPNPTTTAAAQTQTNLSTAIGNSYLSNINQVTPDGKLTYSQTGQNFVSDPLGQKYYTNGNQYVTNPNRAGQQGWKEVNGYYVPTFTATTELSGMQSAIKGQEDRASLNMAELANQQSKRLGNILDSGVNLRDAPNASNPQGMQVPKYQEFGSGPNMVDSYDTDIDTSRYEEALMSRINPQLQQDSQALESKLINQGLQPGSEAYNRAFAQQGQKENDARFGAILSAGQEQSRLANLNRDKASFTNTSRQQEFQNENTTTAGNNTLQDQDFNARRAKNSDMDAARNAYLNERYANRNQSINEITSLMSGAQVTNPNFVSTQGQTMPTVDYAGLINQNYQNKLAAYQQSQAGIGSLLGGVGSLVAMSDKRAKKDIKKVGKVKGKNLYEYSMKGALDDGKRHIGVMAQEVERTNPSAVKTGSDGLKRVNYGKLFAAGRGK